MQQHRQYDALKVLSEVFFKSIKPYKAKLKADPNVTEQQRKVEVKKLYAEYQELSALRSVLQMNELELDMHAGLTLRCNILSENLQKVRDFHQKYIRDQAEK